MAIRTENFLSKISVPYGLDTFENIKKKKQFMITMVYQRFFLIELNIK